MLALGMDKELDFYVRNGYCPGNAGLTIQWAFEDWALAEMAAKMGKKSDYNYFHKRATGWPASFNKELGLILPKRANGEWLHTDPLSGNGYVEANAWQATFGLSHDIPVLARLMGGNDSLCSKLDFAFKQSESTDFVYGYGSGYVSYANQPGLFECTCLFACRETLADSILGAPCEGTGLRGGYSRQGIWRT